VIPLVDKKADKAYIVTKRTSREGDKAKKVIERIEKALDAASITHELLQCDIGDFHDCLRVTGSVIRREIEDGNHVFVNISSGGRILSHACTVAGMMYEADLYYAHAEEDFRVEREPTRGVHEIVTIPPFRIEPPPDSDLRCLRLLASHGGRMTKKSLMIEMLREGLIAVESGKRQTLYSAANRVLRPLKKKKWLKEEGNTRARIVQITEEGLQLLKGFDR
jgi:CRISPR/Cas system-associated protein Csm6